MTTRGRELFIEGLKQLDLVPEERGDKGVVFSYTIKAGRFAGQTVTVGIEVPPDFNVVPPSGPHISPRLIPEKTDGAGNDRAAPSPAFDKPGETAWQYLSRPFVDGAAGWNRTTRDVKAYFHHIKRILESL
jgi:hypothetical protein